MQTLEAFMVFPRLNTIDDVIINGIQFVDTYQGSAEGSVVVRSGNASLGLRFVACDSDPRLQNWWSNVKTTIFLLDYALLSFRYV